MQSHTEAVYKVHPHLPGLYLRDGVALRPIYANPHGGLGTAYAQSLLAKPDSTTITNLVTLFSGIRTYKWVNMVGLHGGYRQMRPITISLDSKTWELAKEKTNFSAWVRAQLRSERNKKESLVAMYCYTCEMVRKTAKNYCTLCGDEFKQDLVIGDE